MGEPGWGCAWSPLPEFIGWWGERGEVKHLSTRRRRYSVSSGERKRRMAKPFPCDDPAGVAVAVLWGACVSWSAGWVRSDQLGG